MHIQEYGPQKQTGLAKVLEVEEYQWSRGAAYRRWIGAKTGGMKAGSRG